MRNVIAKAIGKVRIILCGEPSNMHSKCVDCRQPIEKDARRCSACGSYQSCINRFVFSNIPWFATLLLVVNLFVSGITIGFLPTLRSSVERANSKVDAVQENSKKIQKILFFDKASQIPNATGPEAAKLTKLLVEIDPQKRKPFDKAAKEAGFDSLEDMWKFPDQPQKIEKFKAKLDTDLFNEKTSSPEGKSE